jgi:hypothetical protein
MAVLPSRSDALPRPAHADPAPAGAARPRLSPFGRDLALVLLVKFIVLALIWFAFFRAPLAPRMTMPPATVADRIVGGAPSAEAPHAAP